MDSRTPPLSAETLLEHDAFVRAVARGLLGKNDESADVAQETWLRALGGGPREPGALRGWLGRVAGNLARDRRRCETRRAVREERVARGEAQESVAAAFERLSVQRDVVTAILALDEPYRGVVLLRYFHELEPQAIAERLGTKPATVRTQLVRAHELLRAKLDSRYGREAWVALLLPLGLGAPSPRVGSLPVVVLGLGAVAAAAVIWVRVDDSREPDATPALAAAPVSGSPIEPNPSEPQVPEGRRVASETIDAPATPAAEALAPTERLAPRAELFARSKYHDEERATFSFELGLRDDPTRIAGDEKDLRFYGPALEARIRVGDRGVLVDLGELPVRTLGAWRGELGPTLERVEPRLGHTYLLWSRDDDTDLAAAFEVLELEPGRRCVLEWCATSDGKAAFSSLRDPALVARLATRLIELRSELRRPRELAAPRVWLQVRGGDTIGNAYGVDMAGGLLHIGEVSTSPLDVDAPIDSREAAFCLGGFVPEGKVFVVTRATYSGAALDEPDLLHKAIALVIGGERVVETARFKRASPDSEMERRDEWLYSGTWTGRIEVLPGQETQTYLEATLACVGEAELFGELVDRPGLIARAKPSPPRRPVDPGPPPPPLREPYARLQARKGASGGGRYRVKLDGAVDPWSDEDLDRFDALAAAPLDLHAPLDASDRGTAYCEGGLVPEGQIFVVTQVDYWGFARGDSHGPGVFAIVVGGERIVEQQNAGPRSGSWRGRIEIPPYLERSTYLEVDDSSAGEAILRGVFVPAR